MALAPARGVPHVLQAELEMSAPGPWDDARAERILAACEIAVSLGPHQEGIGRECEKIGRSLAERR